MQSNSVCNHTSDDKIGRPPGEENKNPNNLKVTVLKQVSKNLLADKFSKNRFFLSCIGIGDLYSKSLLNSHFNIITTNSKQSLETKSQQFYKVSLLNWLLQ